MPVASKNGAFLAAVVTGALDGIVSIDEAGIILSFNPAAAAMFNYTPQEVIGQNVRVLMPEPYRGNHNSYLSNYLLSGEAKIIGIGRQVEGQRKDGSIFPMELGVSVIEADGKRFFVSFIHDLTERLRFEARMEELRTNRLDLIENMAVGLAHELKQPLTAITAYLRMLGRMLKGSDLAIEEIEPLLNGATEQAFRAAEITDNLRQFVSRGETVKTPQNLNEVVRAACEFTESLAHERGVKTVTLLYANADRVIINRVQIQQVVVNLKRNAIEAMQGCERRELTVSTRLTDSNSIRVDVADTGPGLPETIKERLFEAFATTKPHGLGVGLSISRSIIETHQGKLWANPNPGGGTIFSFELPLTEGLLATRSCFVRAAP